MMSISKEKFGPGQFANVSLYAGKRGIYTPTGSQHKYCTYPLYTELI